MTTTIVRCPIADNAPGPHGPILGCGFTFEAELDDEGWADCPNCGLGFDPKDPNSQPQPDPTDRDALATAMATFNLVAIMAGWPRA